MSQVPSIGSKLPDFHLPSLEGNEIYLSDFRGKRVSMFMWASW